MSNINPLWDFPIWQYKTDFDDEFNQALQDEIYSIAQEMTHEQKPKDSLWDYNRPNLAILKNTITDITNKLISQDIPEVRELNVKFKCDMGWPNVRHPGLGIELHAHPDASFATTYYVKAPENCGDFVAILDNGRTKRFKPVAGTGVIIPAYILHEVEINKSNDLRISISTDFTTVVDKEAKNALVLRSWCADMLQVREWTSTN